jgi:hypothetical protein
VALRDVPSTLTLFGNESLSSREQTDRRRYFFDAFS